MSTDPIARLDRRAAVKTILSKRDNALVVTGLGSPGYDVFDAGDNDRNFYLWGAMGGASLIGLGLALAQPDVPVVVVTGDGEQLMGVGGLMTIGVKQPSNLTIIVLDNGHFGETGMQMSHTGLGINLADVARASSFKQVLEVTTEAGLDDLASIITDPKDVATFALVRISSEVVERALPPRDGVFLKTRLRGSLGFSVN